MDMLLSLDTAEISEIEEAAGWGVLGGVTTNPTLIAKAGHANPEIAIKADWNHLEEATTAK